MEKKSIKAIQKAKVYIIDDHPLMREGLKRLINNEPDMAVCGESGDARPALIGIEKQKPDVALLDLSLEESSGLDLVKILHQKYPRLPVLVLTMHDESLYAERVLRAGARGYIMKQEASDKVLEALRQVLRGEVYIGPDIKSRLLNQMASRYPQKFRSPIESLSNRELQVFELLGKGRGTRDIAETLKLSVKTIETNRARIKDKLKLKNAVQLVHHAIQWVQDSKKS
jgi:DNA-binding NarL/FixJ family response regulator